MKLNQRQKKITLISAISFVLVLTLVISTVLVVNINKEKVAPRVPEQTDNSELVKAKTETVSSLEQKLKSKNIQNESLLQELKNEHALKLGETSLTEYIRGATTPAELEIRKKKVLAVMEKL
ncbi:1268_t:CDS:1, partial [Funneliformis geosporum]